MESKNVFIFVIAIVDSILSRNFHNCTLTGYVCSSINDVTARSRGEVVIKSVPIRGGLRVC